MFFGHLPAGYLCTTWLLKKRDLPRRERNTLMFLGLLGSVAPDLDMFYFYLVDHRQHWHHTYFSHWPSFWLAAMLLSAMIGWGARNRMWTFAGMVLAINALGHLALDTHVGRIRWLEPFSNQWVYFFEVPSLYHPKILNFVFHWTFVFEIALVSAAVFVFHQNRSQSKDVKYP
jgi:LexA-binding, inner membrane-associated putative hydrolase